MCRHAMDLHTLKGFTQLSTFYNSGKLETTQIPSREDEG